MKKIFTFFAALAITVMATAQNYEYVGPFGMPYVNLNAGAVMPLSNFKDFNANAIAPAAGLELGTYVTPVWGASVEGVAAFSLPKTDDKPLVGEHLVLGNGKVNLSNLLAGYNGYPRRVEFVLVAGAGWKRDYWKVPANEESVDYTLAHRDGMVYNTGAEININLGQTRAWQVSVRPSVIWGHDAENQFGFNPANAQARLNVGFTYKFGNRRVKSHNFVTNDYAVSQHDYDVLAARYDECSKKASETIEKEVLVEKPVFKEVETLSYFGETYITFPIGKYTLSEEGKSILAQLAKHVSSTTCVYVIGSADSKTGTEKRNNVLAEKRAQVVKDELVKLGVPEKDVITDTTIDVTDNVRTSRSAVVTISVK